ncbi:MAG: hypothetical protein HOF33_05505 [Rhodospirillaceae bacterium]|jgi:hypothetical protein|nr:hypothetical protein [Rhodospirillaceae bacterium]MBT5941726.1 hypothetical protein [Rhodospirillaceae bacterium]
MTTDFMRLGIRRYVPSALMVSAFGPLLLPSIGIGTEQVLMYALLPVAIGLLCIGGRSLLFYAPVLFLLFIFVFIILWTTVVTSGGVLSHVTPTTRTLSEEISSFESYFQTIVMILILGALLKGYSSQNAQSLLDKAAKILIIFMSINALIALASVFFNTAPITGYFVREEIVTGGIPLQVDSGTGRFSGIFEFPATAGHAYSLALIMWTFLVRKEKQISFVSLLMAGLIIVGGIVSVSKTFLFGGFPIFFIYWLIPGRVSPRISLKILAIIVAAIGTIAIFIESWIGTRLIIDLFSSGGKYTPVTLFFHFISIRYGIGDDLSVGGIFAYVWEMAPIQGLGFSYLGIADSAYLQFFMQGGLVSVLLYFGFIATIIYLGASEWYRGKEMGRLLTILGIFVFLAGVGSPVITTARISVIFWVILMLVFAVRAAQRAERTGQDKIIPNAKSKESTAILEG